jgi:hypothetical protein
MNHVFIVRWTMNDRIHEMEHWIDAENFNQRQAMAMAATSNGLVPEVQIQSVQYMGLNNEIVDNFYEGV